MSTIEIRDLEMRFGRFVAVNGISLDVAEGEFLTLLGPSGCGKTTLLKMISGFLTPSAGNIRIGGVDVTYVPPEARDTAMCFQSYALFPHLSVEENLLFGLKQRRLGKAERAERMAPVSAQLELEPQLEKLPNQLSGGQQQRVALGRALVMRPGVILFDEPLSNLDAKLRDSVRVEIRRIQQDYNLTAIYVTHDQAEALALSDRILVMNAGNVEQAGTPEEIYHRPQTSFVADFIGGANILEADVVDRGEDNHWILDTALGRLVAESDEPPRSNRIRVCWRPEAARPGDEALNRVSAVINHRSFQGSFTDYFFTEKNQTFRMQMAETTARTGDALAFSLRPSDIVLLEALQ